MPDDAPSAEDLLDALPYGVLVTDADGTIVSASAPARQLAPWLDSPEVRTCRELFSCRNAGGPCETGCLVKRVSAEGRAAPEIRIDTPGGVTPGALWVTVAPLQGGRRAMLHVRPGWRGDRRRRSEAQLRPQPQLRIRVLGRTRVEALEDSLETDWITQRPGQILKYLVCERTRVVMVDEIADNLWPHAGRRAVTNVRYAIHRLRTKLEPRRAPHDPPAFVVSRGSGYELDRARVWIDADEFEHEVDQGRVAMSRLAPTDAAEHLERAMALYRGPFVADEPYVHWATDERNRLAGMAIYATRLLTALAHERGDGADAVRQLQRLAELEPLDVGIHRELVQALLGEGLRGDAKRYFDSFAQRMRRELGQEPGFDLRLLSEQARAADRSWP